jgi:hypothetical protein
MRQFSGRPELTVAILLQAGYQHCGISLPLRDLIDIDLLPQNRRIGNFSEASKFNLRELKFEKER